MIHKSACRFIKNKSSDRIIEASWKSKISFVPIRVVANDRVGLLRDITSAVSGFAINLLDLKTNVDKAKEIATFDMMCEISEIDQLVKIMNRISRIDDVINVFKPL